MKTAVFNEEKNHDYSQQLLSSVVSLDRRIISPTNYSSFNDSLNANHRFPTYQLLSLKKLSQ